MKLKPEEAIEAIKCNYPPSNYSMLREALDLSIELLEKQIPKKPELFRLNDWHYEADCECGEVLYTWQVYCPICGQRIDWELGNEELYEIVRDNYVKCNKEYLEE